MHYRQKEQPVNAMMYSRTLLYSRNRKEEKSIVEEERGKRREIEWEVRGIPGY